LATVLIELEKANSTLETNLQEAILYQQIMDRCDCYEKRCCEICFVVGAQLELGVSQTRNYLSSLKRKAPGFCGVRQSLWEKEDSFITNPHFVAGLSVLEEFAMPFDLLVKPQQLSIVYNLVSKLPNITFNLITLAIRIYRVPNLIMHGQKACWV